MTDTQLQLRRDTAADLALSTPVEGEPGYDKTNSRLIVGTGSRAGGMPVPNFLDIINGEFIAGTVGGTADVITLTLPYSPSSYSQHQSLRFTPSSDNTGAATLNVNSMGAKVIKKYDGGVIVDVEAGDIKSGKPSDVVYDGTYFIISSLEVSTKAPTVQVFTSSGTYYKPTGVKGVEVTVVGAGAYRSSGYSTVTHYGSSSSFGSHCSATGGTSSGAGTGTGGDLNLTGSTGSDSSAGIIGTNRGYGRGYGVANSIESGFHAGGTAVKFIDSSSLGSAEVVTVGTNSVIIDGVVIVKEYY